MGSGWGTCVLSDVVIVREPAVHPSCADAAAASGTRLRSRTLPSAVLGWRMGRRPNGTGEREPLHNCGSADPRGAQWQPGHSYHRLPWVLDSISAASMGLVTRRWGRGVPARPTKPANGRAIARERLVGRGGRQPATAPEPIRLPAASFHASHRNGDGFGWAWRTGDRNQGRLDSLDPSIDRSSQFHH